MKSSLLTRRLNRSRQGFTLIEMIIVLGIIALLVALAMSALSGTTEIAKENAASANISKLKTAMYAYQLESGSYPTTEQGLKALWSKPTAEPIPMKWVAVIDDDLSMDPWGRPYQYVNPGKHNPGSFDVWSMGDDGVSNNDDDIGNWKSTKPSGDSAP